MPTNDGVMFFGQRDRVFVEIFYDNSGPADPSQPIINNAEGVAFRAVNLTGQDTLLEVTGPSGKLLGKDGAESWPIPPEGLTATAQQLRTQAGIRTRGDVTRFSLNL